MDSMVFPKLAVALAQVATFNGRQLRSLRHPPAGGRCPSELLPAVLGVTG